MGMVNIYTHAMLAVNNDDDVRKFWFQALFTKKTTHYLETTRVRPAVRL